MSWRRKMFVSASVWAALLALAEVSLRWTGRPAGVFDPFFMGAGSGFLYPRNATLRYTWGPVPYTVRSNSLGLRGEEIARRKPANVWRVVTIGDSVTDGFFVDNEATWQARLQERWRERGGRRAEVINASRGGGSIDKELEELREWGLPLQPDLVVLTFVSNDIHEILDRGAQDLIRPAAERTERAARRALARFVLTRSAVGEALFDGYLRLRSPAYRARRKWTPGRLGEERYRIAGGERFAENAEEFLRRFGSTDGLVLGRAFDARTQRALDAYGEALREFAALCRRSGARLAVVYFPAYSQIYLEDQPRAINGWLAEQCRALELEFVDLTDGFRRRGAGRVLHLAPLDFHLNPAGHEVFAELLAERLGAEAPGRGGGENVAPSSADQ